MSKNKMRKSVTLNIELVTKLKKYVEDTNNAVKKDRGWVWNPLNFSKIVEKALEEYLKKLEKKKFI